MSLSSSGVAEARDAADVQMYPLRSPQPLCSGPVTKDRVVNVSIERMLMIHCPLAKLQRGPTKRTINSVGWKLKMYARSQPNAFLSPIHH
ncbi:hypothetical protein CPB85DRAFT_1315316 [Mucidula mucida]|nr:hypothetical protein CPB85DRAFT_1315316 [Mucidula mucida]